MKGEPKTYDHTVISRVREPQENHPFKRIGTPKAPVEPSYIYIYKYIHNYIIFTFLGPIMEVFGAGLQGPPNHLGGPDIMSTLCSLQIRDPHLENAIASPVGLIYVREESKPGEYL